MKWYEVELEIPFYGKNFETVQATDSETAKIIAMRKSEVEFNFSHKDILVTNVREINN